MQLNSGRTYNWRSIALRQPPENMFPGSIYQAPQVGMHEGYTNNPQRLGNGGLIGRGMHEGYTFNPQQSGYGEPIGRGMHEGYMFNPQRLGNGGPIRRNRQDTPTFNRPPY